MDFSVVDFVQAPRLMSEKAISGKSFHKPSNQTKRWLLNSQNSSKDTIIVYNYWR